MFNIRKNSHGVAYWASRSPPNLLVVEVIIVKKEMVVCKTTWEDILIRSTIKFSVSNIDKEYLHHCPK